MELEHKELFLRHCPRILMDRADPFPIRYIGCTAFYEARQSESFPKWFVDPRAEGAAVILEYAVYFDYDIQHLYDLEHIWVALDAQGHLKDCWCSFHGMRLRAAGLSCFQTEGERPVMYAQPGKHAMLPHPQLFLLHPDHDRACMEKAGGGVPLPGFLEGKVGIRPETEERVAAYIRKNFAFRPTMEFESVSVSEEQLLPWPGLLERIPELIAAQLERIEK